MIFERVDFLITDKNDFDKSIIPKTPFVVHSLLLKLFNSIHFKCFCPF